jgi:hypothetical protein
VGRLLLLVPLVCSLAACGDSKEHTSRSGGSASCAATVVRGGVTYYGEHVDKPAKTDGSAGTGTIPPCNDTMPPTVEQTQEVALLRIAGIDPADAVVVATQPDVVYRSKRPG